MSSTWQLILLPQKSFFSSPIVIDSIIFRLHYIWSCRLMLVFFLWSFVKSATDSITCYTQTSTIPEAMINVYCWMQNTFTLPDLVYRPVGDDMPHPGMDTGVPEEQRVYQRYYQWVPYFLLLQALLLYAPHHLWKSREDNLVAHSLVGMDRPIVIYSADEVLRAKSRNDVKERVKMVATFLKGRLKTTDNRKLAIFYVLAVLLNLIVVVTLLLLIDAFLGGEFAANGFSVVFFLNKDLAERNDTMKSVFPRMTKCNFRQFGAGGSVQMHDIICALPFNLFYEQIFVFCYIWFLVLVVLDALHLLMLLVAFIFGGVRLFVFNVSTDFMLTKLAKRFFLNMSRWDVGDWFMMYLIGKNMNWIHFNDVLEEVYDVPAKDRRRFEEEEEVLQEQQVP